MVFALIMPTPQIGALLFSNESGLLGMTGEAELILKQWRTGI